MRRWAVVGVLGLIAVACGGGDDEAIIDPGDGGVYSVTLDPADFVATIDNPWFPLTPGSRWVYEATDGEEVERIEVVVTNETRQILGITATVVRDVVSIDGVVIEDTFDWYAQDKDGNVWYLGEDSTEFDGDKVDTAGSWESGVDGALPGIIMQADPTVGDAYRQEFYVGEAEDLAEVVRIGDAASVPFGSYEGLLVIREWNPLEADVVEEKFFARDVGLVLERKVQGGFEQAELISADVAS